MVQFLTSHSVDDIENEAEREALAIRRLQRRTGARETIACNLNLPGYTIDTKIKSVFLPARESREDRRAQDRARRALSFTVMQATAHLSPDEARRVWAQVMKQLGN